MRTPDKTAAPTYDNDFFGRAYAPWLARHPERGAGAMHLLEAVTAAEAARGEAVRRYECSLPETLVVSLTSACNRHCQFCGAADVITGPKMRLPDELLERAFAECRSLGICRIALIGGEPMLFPELDDLIEANPDLFFSIYTNGVLLDGPRIERLSRLANHILIVNVSATNQSDRVTHIDSEVLHVLEGLKLAGTLFGYAATIHQNNRELFGRRSTYEALHGYEPWLGVLFDYLASYDKDPDPLSLTAEERAEVVHAARESAVSRQMMFLCVPEDEEVMGGCGAAGRSWVHLGADGWITPCPFVAYGQHRFPEQSLLDAIRGEYFSELRRRSVDWERLEGNCAYRSAADELHEISRRHGATRYAERTSRQAERRKALKVVTTT